MKDVIVYKTADEREPFVEWLYSLCDITIRQRIEIRIERIRQGNYGDHKRFWGIVEIRLHFGKGYRLYCGEDGDALVVLLAGGDKKNQQKDIRRALAFWEEYHEQKKIQNI